MLNKKLCVADRNTPTSEDINLFFSAYPSFKSGLTCVPNTTLNTLNKVILSNNQRETNYLNVCVAGFGCKIQKTYFSRLKCPNSRVSAIFNLENINSRYCSSLNFSLTTKLKSPIYSTIDGRINRRIRERLTLDRRLNELTIRLIEINKSSSVLRSGWFMGNLSYKLFMQGISHELDTDLTRELVYIFNVATKRGLEVGIFRESQKLRMALKSLTLNPLKLELKANGKGG